MLSRLPHLMAAHLWGVPLTLYFADRLIDRPNRRDAAWLTGVVAATAATSLYWLALAGLVVGVVIAAGLVTRRWRGAVAAGGASLAGLVIASPILWPYLRFAAAGATRPIELAAQFSATPAGYLTATSRLHAGWSATFFRDEVNVFFAGAAALALAVVGILVALRDVRSRRRMSTLVAVAVIGVVLSLGPSTAVYRWLYDWLPPLHGLRAPARFGYLYLLAIAMAASFGLAALVVRWPTRRARATITGVAIAITAVEVTQAPIRTEPFDRVPPIYGFVGGLAGPVVLVEAPFFPADAVFENGEYQLNATAHWRPLMNGTSGFTPRSYRRRAAVFWFFPRPGTVEAMKHEGATHLMVHLDRFDAREAELVRVALFERPDLRLLAADGRGHRLYAIR